MKTSKRMKKINEKINEIKSFTSIESIIDTVKSCCTAKFVESIDLAINLGINAKKSDESIRGSFVLMHGIPKKIRIAAFVPGTMEDEVKKAGADVVGLDDLIEEIKKTGKVNFDVCFAHMDVIQKIVPIAKILGQNGVMPNKKDGTVIKDVADAIIEVKQGKKCMFRNDDAGYLHLSIGKQDMDTKKISDNIKDFISHVRTLKPPKVKEMVKNVYLSSTMGTGIEIPLKYL